MHFKCLWRMQMLCCRCRGMCTRKTHSPPAATTYKWKERANCAPFQCISTHTHRVRAFWNGQSTSTAACSLNVIARAVFHRMYYVQNIYYSVRERNNKKQKKNGHDAANILHMHIHHIHTMQYAPHGSQALDWEKMLTNWASRTIVFFRCQHSFHSQMLCCICMANRHTSFVLSGQARRPLANVVDDGCVVGTHEHPSHRTGWRWVAFDSVMLAIIHSPRHTVIYHIYIYHINQHLYIGRAHCWWSHWIALHAHIA